MKSINKLQYVSGIDMKIIEIQERTEMLTNESVSYTHLDVYKRQIRFGAGYLGEYFCKN